MADQLNISPATGTQATTQSPQTAGQSNNGGAKSSTVQPGTATALLNSNSGVPLKNQALSVVNLSPTASSSTVSKAAAPTPTVHHVNGILLLLPALFLVLALALFWITTRSAKTTT